MHIFDWFLCPSADSEASSRGGNEGESFSEEKPLSAAGRASLVKIWHCHLLSSENALENLSMLADAEGMWALISEKYSRTMELQQRSLWYARYLEHLIFEADQPLFPPEHFKQSKSMRISDLYHWMGIRRIMFGEQYKADPLVQSMGACTPTSARRCMRKSL